MKSTPSFPIPSITHEAHKLINGSKRDSYGSARESFTRIATMWSVVLVTKVTPCQVALCMAALKLCRESFKHSRDNCVDGAAYFDLADQVSDDKP